MDKTFDDELFDAIVKADNEENDSHMMAITIIEETKRLILKYWDDVYEFGYLNHPEVDG